MLKSQQQGICPQKRILRFYARSVPKSLYFLPLFTLLTVVGIYLILDVVYGVENQLYARLGIVFTVYVGNSRIYTVGYLLALKYLVSISDAEVAHVVRILNDHSVKNVFHKILYLCSGGVKADDIDLMLQLLFGDSLAGADGGVLIGGVDKAQIVVLFYRLKSLLISGIRVRVAVVYIADRQPLCFFSLTISSSLFCDASTISVNIRSREIQTSSC